MEQFSLNVSFVDNRIINEKVLEKLLFFDIILSKIASFLCAEMQYKLYFMEDFMQNLYRITRYELNPDSQHTFRPGSRYQILFVTQGSCQLFANGKKCLCRSPDMLLLKPGQAQALYAASQKSSCFLLCISIPVESLAALSDSTCDLVQKFQFAPYDTTVIHAEAKSSMLIQNIIIKLDTLDEEEITLGLELYEKSLFTTFLVLFLRTCVQNDRVHQSRQKKVLMIDDVFEYISRHLTDDLSLNTLEKEFFVSKEHISREFKKNTGLTLHSYIMRSRIDLSKKYLLQGKSVRDVCQLCGFCSYNHFFKAFKKECGMTPMAFIKEPMAW